MRSVLVQDNGKIVIGGYFKQYNGTSCNGIARFEAMGCSTPDLIRVVVSMMG
ncbi:MAG: delta-60 repeat domain-containing protein [Crocinitomicaceae bacterium]|nr:delta-60 repeat domain-containing protein [Crocinitomicaceae bacterium]